MQLALYPFKHADIGKIANILRCLPLIVVYRFYAQPFWENFAAFAPIPNLTSPLSLVTQRLPHLRVKLGVMLARFQFARIFTDDLIALIAGDPAIGRIDVKDAAAHVGDDYRFI